ncbi:hypothetical protein C8J56DRAFT_941874 [Mycena floridula]|nr:hypothetical protein C8J56DRAFT_941874 [Mycena floridula]
MWQPSDVITVKFLNGTNADRNEVKEHAVKWTGSGAANLTLKFVSDYEDALVRVKFDTGSSDTVLGTACKGITDQSEPTIELSIPSNAPSEDRPYFILHEFGHVLGFIHEHQSPNANIPWNRDNVYAYYADRGRTQQWAEHDILNVVPAMDVAATREYDPKSIMLYRIQEDWVTDPSYAAPQVNKALSEKDKWFAARCYPH